jgi:D-tyrosyl-tRNA(Tyr) deacylase
MRAVVQRVSSASVAVVEGDMSREVGRIGTGLLVLVGVEREDGPTDVRYVASKVGEMRVFQDPADPLKRMNLSVADIGGGVLLVSQFTLAGDCRKGGRPSFDAAAPPEVARSLYEEVARELRATGLTVATGEFQAGMHVALVNDGPVTLLLDSRKRF